MQGVPCRGGGEKKLMFAKLQGLLYFGLRMFINFGSKKIKHKIIWFLSDIDCFTERKLYIFKPQFNKYITVLSEKSKISGNVFQQKEIGQKALNTIKREEIRKLYTSEEIKITKGKPCGWIFGENTEFISNNKITIKQKRCDFFGQKELIN